MTYAFTYFNLLELLQQVGALKKEQIITFFSYEIEPEKVTYLLNQAVIRNIIQYDEERDVYRFMGSQKTTKEVEQQRIMAFWPIAYMGSIAVAKVDVLTGPVQYYVIGSDNLAYDFSLISSRNEAINVMRDRNLSLARGIEDNVNHIAVITRKTDRKFIDQEQFQNICLVDLKTRTVEYDAL